MIIPIIDRIKSWETDAFGDLYELSVDRVYRMIYHRTLDTPQTEDIVSMVFMKAFRSVKSFRGTTEGEYFSWLLRIAYNTMIDSFRDVTHESLDDHEASFWKDTMVAHDMDNKSKLEEVLSYMDTLSEKEQAILRLRIWDELSYQEIADITGESVDNAKKIVSRSLAKISANVEYLLFFTLALNYGKL